MRWNFSPPKNKTAKSSATKINLSSFRINVNSSWYSFTINAELSYNSALLPFYSLIVLPHCHNFYYIGYILLKSPQSDSANKSRTHHKIPFMEHNIFSVTSSEMSSFYSRKSGKSSSNPQSNFFKHKQMLVRRRKRRERHVYKLHFFWAVFKCCTHLFTVPLTIITIFTIISINAPAPQIADSHLSL